MWIFEKKMEFPVKIKKTNPALAKIIITQYGGCDGEVGAALRYLSQRFAMLTPQAKATLTDIGTEELAHIEIVGAMCLQLSEGACPEEIRKAGFDSYYVDHGTGIYPCSAAGVPFNAACIASKGDPITDLYEDLAAEQKARTTYEYLMKMTDDPDVLEPLKFLREREIVHFQRFGEALRIVQDKLDAKDFCDMKPIKKPCRNKLEDLMTMPCREKMEDRKPLPYKDKCDMKMPCENKIKDNMSMPCRDKCDMTMPCTDKMPKKCKPNKLKDCYCCK